jgi:branched-chain amino acid transport system substrate-binding protein
MANWRLGIALLALASAAGGGALAAASDDTIVLGAAVSLTGNYSTNGKNTKDGYELAVKRVNEMGGVKIGGKSYKLKVVYYDDESTPARGAQLVERLINQDGVKYILGPYSSGLTKAIAPVTEKYKIPMVEANGADRDLFTQGYRYTFGVLSTAEQYLTEAVNLGAEVAKAKGRDLKTFKIAIVVENDPFSADVRNGVVEDAKKYGMPIVIDDKFPRDINDMTPSLTKVRALKPDLLVVSGHDKGALLGARSVYEGRVDVPMMAMTHCDSAQVAEKFGKNADYILCGSQWDRSLKYSDKWFGTAEEYAQRFQKEYNYAPPYQGAESTAGVLVYVDAFTRAGTLDVEKVRDAIATTDLATIYGQVKFDETGKNIAKPMVLYQIQNGEYKLVAPTKVASAKFLYPTPVWTERMKDK